MGNNIISIGHFTNDNEIKKAILSSDKIRSKALEECYNIPNYKSLSLDQKNIIYDKTVKRLLTTV